MKAEAERAPPPRDATDVRDIEQRAQEQTCWTLAVTTGLCVALGAAVLQSRHQSIIVLIGCSFTLFFAGAGMAIRRGHYHPVFKYISVIVQVSLVTCVIYVDADMRDPGYALASMPPLFYGLVTAVAGLTLSPLLGLVAGLLSAAQFILLYALVLRPRIPEAELDLDPVLGFEITIMKAIVLGGIGFASAFMARKVRRLLHTVEVKALAEARLELIDRELAVAAQVQSRLVPEELPRVDGLDLAAFYGPSRQVGGDAYDVIVADDGSLIVTIADVSGKGYPAALTMAAAGAVVRSVASTTTDPLAIVTGVNRELVRSSVGGRFVTLFLARIEPDTGTVTYVNAGHNPPYVVEPGGSLHDLPAGGPVLGALDGVTWETGRAQLPPGAALVSFTDGLTELRSPSGELFGEARVEDVLASVAGTAPEVMRERLLAAAREFLAGGSPSDDLTLLLLRRRP